MARSANQKLKLLYLRTVAHSRLLSIADDGGVEQGGVLKQMVKLGLLRGQVGDHHGIRMLGINHRLKTHGLTDAGQLSSAHAVPL